MRIEKYQELLSDQIKPVDKERVKKQTLLGLVSGLGQVAAAIQQDSPDKKEQIMDAVAKMSHDLIIYARSNGIVLADPTFLFDSTVGDIITDEVYRLIEALPHAGLGNPQLRLNIIYTLGISLGLQDEDYKSALQKLYKVKRSESTNLH